MNRRRLWLFFLLFGLMVRLSSAQDETLKVTVQWDKVTRVSQTTPTLQVVVNPPLRRGTAFHDNAFKALRDLKADYVRYVPWMPYPKLGVAELEPPANGKTSWDFSLIDPMSIDFFEATKGHPIILNFSTIPQWMFKTEKPVPYPSDPNEPTWKYEEGTQLRDESLKEPADYFARLLSWYTQGGFTDEYGVRHESGYHFQVPYWEVLNEVEYEHNTTPQTYTRLYDAVVSAMRRVQPETKFVGMGLATPGGSPKFFEYFEYFLNPKNHQPGIPLDFISYHFYAFPAIDESPDIQQYTFFTQADGFLNLVQFIESIRMRLSPGTRTAINEIGSVSADDWGQTEPGHVTKPIPNSYWNLSGAMFAYLFGKLSSMGIDVVGESQLVGYPTQFPSVTMLDWETGKPNARYWVLKLLIDNFGPGDKLVETKTSVPYVYSLGVVTKDGKRRLLLINQRNRTLKLAIAGVNGARQDSVDVNTAFDPPASAKLTSDEVVLHGFSVSAVTLP